MQQEKEKAEKKAVKAEKDRKEKEAQNKSRSLLSSFLKPKAASIKSGVIRHKGSVGTSSAIADSTTSTEFEKTFKPFIVKKDASLAPINRFSSRRKGKEVIVIDQDESLDSAVASSSKMQVDCLNGMCVGCHVQD